MHGEKTVSIISTVCSHLRSFTVTAGKFSLARDRLGIKPLYYIKTPDEFRFASSLPALLAGGGVDTSIDPVALNFFMTFHSVVPAPRTILKGVKKLPPASHMTPVTQRFPY